MRRCYDYNIIGVRWFDVFFTFLSAANTLFLSSSSIHLSFLGTDARTCARVKSISNVAVPWRITIRIKRLCLWWKCSRSICHQSLITCISAACVCVLVSRSPFLRSTLAVGIHKQKPHEIYNKEMCAAAAAAVFVWNRKAVGTRVLCIFPIAVKHRKQTSAQHCVPSLAKWMENPFRFTISRQMSYLSYVVCTKSVTLLNGFSLVLLNGSDVDDDDEAIKNENT